jgi:hypothetical protein
MTVAPLSVAMLTLNFSGGTISFAQDPTGKFYLMNTLVKTRYECVLRLFVIFKVGVASVREQSHDYLRFHAVQIFFKLRI